MTPKIGIFPGSFDPLTNGHLDLIARASRLFDELIVLVAVNTNKKALFAEDERVALVQEAVAHLDNVRVDVLKDGLVANYFKKVGATALVRGVRNTTDYEYEFTIASGNRQQAADLETVILYAADNYRFLSSSLIKEIAHFHGDISQMVPPAVEQAIQAKFSD
ncbi:pantetheine-phosphate adenylyltransferase [Hutsoniella sourekii]|uniref:pantetheine-phosphate adenylyltransferase n=1 Tax=Hutsoniella sourekii TaxID=87650 RepID=UPI0004866D80|nr:pantetheine-phosphate adenylyltransferase [Hutsoniella sourekii]